MCLSQAKKQLEKYSSKRKAKVLKSFFKTAKGEYAEGDIFIGVGVPQIRKIARQYKTLSLSQSSQLLESAIHEERLLALLILILQFKEANVRQQQKIYKFYLKHTRYINNWDLVDLSAPHIVGAYLSSKNEAPRAKARGFLDDSAPVERNPAHRASIPGLKTGVLSRRDKKILYILATSKNMWKRRIAIVSTFYFIRNGEFNDSLNIAKILLTDKEDLLHKATGWMLREVGKRSSSILENFLNEYYTIMPRTMLRYAIERFSPAKRKAYLEGKIKAY